MNKLEQLAKENGLRLEEKFFAYDVKNRKLAPVEGFINRYGVFGLFEAASADGYESENTKTIYDITETSFDKLKNKDWRAIKSSNLKEIKKILIPGLKIIDFLIFYFEKTDCSECDILKAARLFNYDASEKKNAYIKKNLSRVYAYRPRAAADVEELTHDLIFGVFENQHFFKPLIKQANKNDLEKIAFKNKRLERFKPLLNLNDLYILARDHEKKFWLLFSDFEIAISEKKAFELLDKQKENG